MSRKKSDKKNQPKRVKKDTEVSKKEEKNTKVIKESKRTLSHVGPVSIKKSTKIKNINNKEGSYVNNEAQMSSDLTADLKSLLRILEDKRNVFEQGEFFNPITIAYMARWGTGKTSKMLKIKESVEKSFNFLTINLWRFSNQADEKKGKDLTRAMVNDVFTQIYGSENAHEKVSTKSTVTSGRNSGIEGKLGISVGALNSFLGLFSKKSSGVETTERKLEFVDEFLLFLNTLIEKLNKDTNMPTIIVLDDLDRVEVDKVKAILDSIISFLFVKNIVYILPIDEKHVLEGIKDKVKGKNPYSSLNKYFNYSIRSAFIPSMNKMSMLESVTGQLLEKYKPDTVAASIISEAAGSSYRAIKDFVNSYIFNKELIEENIDNIKEEIKNIPDEYIAFGVSLQALAPRLIDYLSDNPGRLDDISKLARGKDFFEKLIKKSWPNVGELGDQNIKLIDRLFWKDVKNDKEIIEYTKDDEISTWELENIIKIVSLLEMLKVNNILKNSDDKFKLWIAITLAKIEGKLAISFLKNKSVLETIISMDMEVENE